ncbi:MAG: DnaJ domain-containing protein [Spirochaetales bacterium]|jgi:hypothetical protein|nr:DnaJ domain-containing protein [Spirochaetales bacterium]
MKKDEFFRFSARWKGRLLGSLFGVLAGPFGIILGFLVGFLVDSALGFSFVRRRTAAFLADPEKTSLKNNETGKYSFFCLAAALCMAAGGRPDKTPYGLYRRLAEYYPVEKEDAEYLRAILENMDAFGPAADLAVHAGEVRRRVTENGAGKDDRTPEGRLLDLYAGILCFAEGPVPQDSLAALILRVITVIWDIHPAHTGIEKKPLCAEETPWRVLGLEPKARETEVKKVFRLLASQFHPDGGWALSEIQRREMEEAFRRIRDAYDACMRMRRESG